MMLSGLLALAFLGKGAPQTPVRPNVVIVLVDDLGWQDTSLSFGVTPKIVGSHFRTPNLERLSKRGVTVNNAYSSGPVCTPTRVSLLTGYSPAKTRVTNWVSDGGDTDPNHSSIASVAWNGRGLQPGEYKTLPELFRQAGYLTAHIGKAHFGSRGTPGADPHRLGFDINVAGGSLGHPNSYYGSDSFASKKNSAPGTAPNDVPGLESYHGKDIYLEEALSKEAEKVIQRAKSEQKPLFLLFAPYAVHTPIMPNKKLLAKYERSGLDSVEVAYGTMVESVDMALGAIVNSLEKKGMLQDTYVVFTSDNGGLSQSARGGPKNLHNLPLRSGKGSAYEGGFRVPFVLAGPDVPAAVSMSKTVLVTADLYPTLLDLAKVPYAPVEGRSLASNFRSATDIATGPRYWHYPHFRGLSGPGLEPFSAIRDGDFKLIYFYLDQRWEMYNLSADAGETVDLIKIMNPERHRKFEELGGKLLKWLEECKASYPISKATGDPVIPTLGLKHAAFSFDVRSRYAL